MKKGILPNLLIGSFLLLFFQTHPNLFDVANFFPSQKMQVAFSQQSSAFGKTHFIVGYEGGATQEPAEKKIEVEPLPPGITIPDVFFTPDDSIRQTLINLIKQEQERIQIAMFVFTEKNIAQALLEAQKRGVPVEIVTDSACLRDRNNKIGLLCQNNVAVYVYDASSTRAPISTCMHHKFILFKRNINNKPLIWTGSYNFTRAASETNQENALILDDQKLISKFSVQFERLKRRAYRYGHYS